VGRLAGPSKQPPPDSFHFHASLCSPHPTPPSPHTQVLCDKTILQGTHRDAAAEQTARATTEPQPAGEDSTLLAPPLRAARAAHTAVPPTLVAGAKRPRVSGEEAQRVAAKSRVSSPPQQWPRLGAVSPSTASPKGGLHHAGAAGDAVCAVTPVTGTGGCAAAVLPSHGGRASMAASLSPVPWPLESHATPAGRGMASSAGAAATPGGGRLPLASLTSPLSVLADACTTTPSPSSSGGHDENTAPSHHAQRQRPAVTPSLVAPVQATCTKPRTSFASQPSAISAGTAGAYPSAVALAAAAPCVRVRSFASPRPRPTVSASYLLSSPVQQQQQHMPGWDVPMPSHAWDAVAEMPIVGVDEVGGADRVLSPVLVNGFARLAQLRARSGVSVLVAA
jgi:hypothetical protein